MISPIFWSEGEEEPKQLSSDKKIKMQRDPSSNISGDRLDSPHNLNDEVIGEWQTKLKLYQKRVEEPNKRNSNDIVNYETRKHDLSDSDSDKQPPYFNHGDELEICNEYY